MSDIRDEARQEAERQYPALNPGDVELTYPRGALRATARKAFERGAVWASEQADRDPSDAEVEAAKAVLDSVEYADEPQAIRAALIAAQEVRNHE